MYFLSFQIVLVWVSVSSHSWDFMVSKLDSKKLAPKKLGTSLITPGVSPLFQM